MTRKHGLKRKTAPGDVLIAKTPETAARRLHAWLQWRFHDIGADEAVVLFGDDAPRCAAAAVVWEGGPYEWAIALSMGCPIHAGESDAWSNTGPFPDGISGPGWSVECENSFTLCFY